MIVYVKDGMTQRSYTIEWWTSHYILTIFNIDDSRAYAPGYFTTYEEAYHVALYNLSILYQRDT